MATRLHSTERDRESAFNGLTQAIQDVFYQFRITTAHEAESRAQKAETKYKKATSTVVRAKAFFIYSYSFHQCIGTSCVLELQRPSHSRANYTQPKAILAVTNGDEDPPELEDVKPEVTLKPLEKQPK